MRRTRRRAISSAGIIVGAMALAGAGIWHFRPPGAAAPPGEDAAALTIPQPQAPPAIEPALAGLTNAQLRAETEDFAAGIRTLENAYKLERAQIANNNSIQDAQSELDRIRAGYAERFQRDYRPRAVSLRRELLQRLNRPLTGEIAAATSPADGGPLAGPSPLSDLGDYLSGLAAQLP